MQSVFIAALSIATATALGAMVGQRLKGLPTRADCLIGGGAAGMMLCAAVCGLVIPATEQGSVAAVCMGVGLGGMLLRYMNVLVPQCLHKRALDVRSEEIKGLLFVFAMALHHLPEGLAAGVSFGADSAVETAAVCGGIAVQNIPEAMMIMPAMMHGAHGKRKAWIAAAVSGGVEVLGLFLGYTAIQLTTAALPLLMGLAAGAMLFIILDGMVPDGYAAQKGKESTYSVLAGFCLMLLLMELLEFLLL